MLNLLLSLTFTFSKPIFWDSYICDNATTLCFKVTNLPITFNYRSPWFHPYMGISVTCDGVRRSFSSMAYRYHPQMYLPEGHQTLVVDCTAGGLEFE